MVAGTAISAVGAVQAGQASKSAAAYQAQVARNNATIAEQNADYALRAGAQKEQTEGMKAAAVGGRVRAAIAANGVDVNTGSASDVQEGVRDSGTLDQQTVDQDAALKAYGYRSQATSFDAQAGLSELEGENAESAGNTRGLGTLLSGLGAAAGTYKPGAPTPPAKAWSNPDFAGGTEAQYGWAGRY